MKIEVEVNGEVIQLTEKQKTFCELFAISNMRGNGTQCYIEAYNIDLTKKGAYASARACASENLTKPNILTYIRSMYETTLNDEVVDNELAFLINQNADFRSKMSAIKEYNSLKQRITKKIDHTTKGEKVSGYKILED